MPVDVDALVVDNRRLSVDDNVLSLDAPDLARQVQPGQFVMVRPGRHFDPLLRRPFSVFEILRGDEGRPRGISILNKRIGRGTSAVYALRPGERLPTLGPLGRPFPLIDPPAEAWMVAGGVGLAPFVTLTEALADRGTPLRLFYGGRHASDLYHLDFFERHGVHLSLSTEDGSRGTVGLVTAPLGNALAQSLGVANVTLYACGPTPMMRAAADLAAAHRRRCFVSVEQVMGCGLGGCYSCVVPVNTAGGSHYVRSCLEGPVFEGGDLVWEGLGH